MTLEQLVQQWRRLASHGGPASIGYDAAANAVEAWLAANPAAQDTRRLLIAAKELRHVLVHEYGISTNSEAFLELDAAMSLPASTPAEEAP